MKHLQALKRFARGHVYSVIVCAIATAAVVAWALAPVAEAVGGALHLLAQALGGQRRP